MAQTKTKAKTKPKTKSKAKGKSNASAAKGKSNASARSRGSSNRRNGAAKQQKNQPTAIKKLTGPATATGAAMLAVAGGLAATRRRNGRLRKIRKSVKGIDLPSADTAFDWVEDKATTLGDAGYRVAKLSSQARKVKKSVSSK